MEGWWRGDRETQTVSETDREMGGGGVAEVVEGRQIQTVSETERWGWRWWRGDRETQTVSKTDREMGGGGVVEGRQRNTDSE